MQISALHEGMHGMDKRNYELDWNRIALLLKLGIIGALIILTGDILMLPKEDDDVMTFQENIQKLVSTLSKRSAAS